MSNLIIAQHELFDVDCLTPQEQTERQILENGIREGMLIAWRNLEQIRDKRLYRSTHRTFDAYCGEVWGLSRNLADKQIKAAVIVENLSTNCTQNILPTTESQARPLAPLPPKEQVQVWEKAVEIAPDSKPTARDVEIAKGIVKTAHVSQNTGNNEWYTPSEYIEAARQTMGCIDLDPSSCEVANEVVNAESFFTIKDDGLTKDWICSGLWMNPPYAQPLIMQFCEKLINEIESENVDQACVLVNNATETKWFKVLSDKASAVCFPESRIRFWSPDKTLASPLQGQAILYFGKNIGKFDTYFSGFGGIWRK